MTSWACFISWAASSVKQTCISVAPIFPWAVIETSDVTQSIEWFVSLIHGKISKYAKACLCRAHHSYEALVIIGTFVQILDGFGGNWFFNLTVRLMQCCGRQINDKGKAFILLFILCSLSKHAMRVNDVIACFIISQIETAYKNPILWQWMQAAWESKPDKHCS